MLLMATVPMIAGDKPQRVKFARGRTTAVLKGRVKDGNTKLYVLGASQGQTMSVHVTSKGKGVQFTLSSAQDIISDPTDDWSGDLPDNGDYTIAVFSSKSQAQPYTLEVTIR
jgi:hypothetical protein